MPYLHTSLNQVLGFIHNKMHLSPFFVKETASKQTTQTSRVAATAEQPFNLILIRVKMSFLKGGGCSL